MFDYTIISILHVCFYCILLLNIKEIFKIINFFLEIYIDLLD